ncbi:hypothetical protein [Acinetobacter junii]|uniref:hypothetical protein n=1 Tax=Acinetobacter junii TaxID=40215 RepID=UPI001900697E|nr:hypothetical protein [Acinetobacter junii]MBJ8440051.1 hypothetical protein [Acinetobacter junii]
MFKVGDKVVAISNQLHGGIRVVQEIIRGQQLVFKHDGFHKSLCRHATPEEIALGHRIDLEDLRDCDISPNCKKFEEQVK